MGSKTKIEWCDASWNPVTGCLHGCDYCYARRMAQRFSGVKIGNYNGQICELEEPYKAANGKINPYPYEFLPTFHRYRLDTLRHWVKPKTIFVCSMADLFGEWVPDEWINIVFDVCRMHPQHRYLFLTKNPKRLCEMANNDTLPEEDNFWYGCSLDSKDARMYGGRFSDNIFLSIEPLTEYMNVGLGSFGRAKWIIIGAETGNRKDKITPKREWIENICEAAAITQAAVFMKDSLIPIMGEENMRREFPWEME